MNWPAVALALGAGLTVSSLCALNGFDHSTESKLDVVLLAVGIVLAAIGAGTLAA